MEPKFQSSFIPKGPIAQPGVSGVTLSRNKKSFFGFIATLIFIVAVLAAGGVFAYKIYLGRSITSMNENLELARKSLEPETINELSLLNQRILSTKDLLTKHSVISPLFDFLEASTLKNVRFTSFKYGVIEKVIQLEMKGQARGYAAVALQSDIFNKNSSLTEQVFGDLDLDDNGNVIFTYSAKVDPALVSYKVTAPLVPAASTATTTATSTQARTATTTATTSKPVTR